MTSAPAPLEGRVIGRYRVGDRIGGGGMGVVHEAHDEHLDRLVALKFLLPQLGSDPAATERFRLEARMVAALDHPNICTVHDIGETDDGLLYLAMSRYDGGTVADRMAKGALPIEDAVRITVQVLRALDTAHARGIIHRDIKPSNVLVTHDGIVKLLDFGIAKLADVTLTGSMAGPVGTLAYMSPEQALGRPLDARSDIWSVGVMLYELLTTRRPYENGFAAAMTGDLRQPLPATARALRAEVPVALDAIIQRALTRAPEERFGTASEFEAALMGLGIITSSGDRVRETQSAAAPSRSRGRRVWVPLAALVVIATAGGLWLVRSQGTLSGAQDAGVRSARSVAVLPLVDQSEQRNQQYLADGLTEEITSTLSRVDGLKVASITSAFAHRSRAEDIRTIGRTLGVSHIVEGSLQRSGDQLRITARLVGVDDGLQVWNKTFLRTAGDAFVLQQEIAEAVARALQLKLVVGSTDSLAVRPDATAYELYLKGRYAWSTRTESSMRLALRFFEQAVQNDSSYAPAFAGMADANAVLGFYDYLSPAEAFPKAEAAARRAIALDPSLAAPHATLGYAALYYHWDVKRGESELRRAIELNDEYATGHQWYGNLLAADGRFADAVREMQRAQQVDPLSLVARAAEGWVWHFAGDRTKAMARFRAVLETNPDYAVALAWAGETLADMDSLPQAVAMHRRLLATSDSSGSNIATLARTLALGGQREEAERLLAILVTRDAGRRYVPAYDVAKVYAALGRPADAILWLEKARAQRSHSMALLRVDPAWRRVRDDPRFGAMVATVLPK